MSSSGGGVNDWPWGINHFSQKKAQSLRSLKYCGSVTPTEWNLFITNSSFGYIFGKKNKIIIMNICFPGEANGSYLSLCFSLILLWMQMEQLYGNSDWSLPACCPFCVFLLYFTRIFKPKPFGIPWAITGVRNVFFAKWWVSTLTRTRYVVCTYCSCINSYAWCNWLTNLHLQYMPAKYWVLGTTLSIYVFGFARVAESADCIPKMDEWENHFFCSFASRRRHDPIFLFSVLGNPLIFLYISILMF